MRIGRIVLLALCGLWLASAVLFKPCYSDEGLFGGMVYVWLTDNPNGSKYMPELHVACTFASSMLTAYLAVLTSPYANRRQKQVAWMAPAALCMFLGFSFPASISLLFGLLVTPIVAGIGSVFAVVTCFMHYLRNDCL
jgi:hypothetical protein